MIEINLIPDIKQEFLRARQVRTMVISGAVVVGIACIGVVVLLAIYLFGVQGLRSSLADSDITKKEQELKGTQDLSNVLTIQSQLLSIGTLHSEENITSRVFDLLAAINPASPNQVTFSNVKFDSENGTVHIDGQAANGFVAADVFKKTIQATSFRYKDGDKTTTSPIAKAGEGSDSGVVISNLSYGEDSTGAKVLRFSVDLTYDSLLFAATSSDVIIVRPKQQDATDSSKYLPESLFGSRASDIGGKQ